MEVDVWEEAEKRMNVIGQNGNGGEHYAAEGVKHDLGKPSFRLIPQVALEEVAQVMTYGAKKYAPDNWRVVPNAHERYLDAALRHINAHLRGESLDAEGGHRHLAHAVCSLLMAMESPSE